MLRNTKGFTLIELMIVVVIIGILAAIAIPNFISMQDRAREGSVKANMHTLQLSVEDFAVQNDGVYPVSGTDDAAVVALLPGGVAPTNPFDGAASTITWGGAAASQGNLGYDDASNVYDITGYGEGALLALVLTNG